MDIKIFKKNVSHFLSSKGFLKKGNYYYLVLTDLAIVIGFQKSNFANKYFINIGYIILAINPTKISYKCEDGDVRSRFSIYTNEKYIDYFDLDTMNIEFLESSLCYNDLRYVNGVTTIEELKRLLINNPAMLYQTTLKAKQYLEIE